MGCGSGTTGGTFVSPEFAVVTNSGSGSVSTYSISNGVLSSAPVATTTAISGSVPRWVAINPAGGFGYVSYGKLGDVSTYSISNGALSSSAVSTTAAISGSFPNKIVINPAGTFAYVANFY